MAILIVVGSLLVGFLIVFLIWTDFLGYGWKRQKFLLVNPSEKQMLALYKVTSTNKIDLVEAHQVLGSSSLVEITLDFKKRDRYLTATLLEQAGVKYQVISDLLPRK